MEIERCLLETTSLAKTGDDHFNNSFFSTSFDTFFTTSGSGKEDQHFSESIDNRFSCFQDTTWISKKHPHHPTTHEFYRTGENGEPVLLGRD
jgi:hypothetical protein